MIDLAVKPDSANEQMPLKPLDVAIYLADQNPHRDRSLGITTMTRALLDQFATRADVNATQIISSSSFAAPQSAIESKRIPLRTDRPIGRLLTDGFHPWFVNPNADVWYYPKGYAPRFSLPKLPCVGTMHDVIVQYYADRFPNSRPRFAFRYWINSVRRSLEKFDCVLTVSNHAATQLKTFCDRHAIETPEICVTYEGTHWERYRSLRFEKRNQVIHLASSAPHKRTNHLLEMWQTLTKRGRDLPHLLMVGEDDAETRSTISQDQGVSLRPRMPIESLRDAVGQSLALIIPSEIEGFGLPALESYYVGTPACFVNKTSVDEVLNTGSEDGESIQGSFDLDDVDSFAVALDQVLALGSQNVRCTSDRLYQAFSTERIATRVISALRRTASV